MFPLNQLRTWFTTLALFFIIGCVYELNEKTGKQVQVTIDASVTYQVMDGFGSSQRLFDDPHVIGGPDDSYDRTKGLVMTIAQQDEILDRLYMDLRLTRVRPGIYPVELEPVNDNDDPKVTDLSKFFFEWKRNDGFFDYVNRAKARGLTTWWLSPGNLESWMTKANPEEYVEWAMAVIRRWRDNGLELPYYSIMNEPGYKRGDNWSGEYIRDVVKLLGPKLQAEGFNTKIVVPDDLNATQAYQRSQIILADPVARQYVGALAFHLYQEPLSNAIKMKQLSEQYGIPLWMTEYSQSNAFTWANTMHDLLSKYNVSAVDHMSGFGGGGGSTPISLKRNGTQYLGYKQNKHYYTIGQFSRFVKPGSQRIQADTTDRTIKITAYKDGQNIIVVAINSANTERIVQFNLNRLLGITEVQPIRTSETENWAVLEPIPAGGSTFMATLPPASVTTFIMNNLDPPTS